MNRSPAELAVELVTAFGTLPTSGPPSQWKIANRRSRALAEISSRLRTRLAGTDACAGWSAMTTASAAEIFGMSYQPTTRRNGRSVYESTRGQHRCVQ